MNFKQISSKLKNLSSKGLVKDTLWMFLAKGSGVVIQAFYFVIIARFLGAENYGSFIGVTALASLIFSFAALGTEDILVQQVSVNKSLFNKYWGNTLFILLGNTSLIIIALLIFSPHIFSANISRITIAMILLADLICLGLLTACYKAFVAIGRVKKLAQLGVLYNCTKLIAALCLVVFFPQPTITIWASLYLASSAIIATVGIILVNRLAGSPRPDFSKIKSEIQQGFFFSIAASANNVNANLDKTMLASMSTLAATGIYGSAYRFIDVGSIVLFSLFSASYPKFFRHGASGIGGSFNFARRLLPFILSFGIVSLIGYLVFAPLVPVILGDEYTEAIAALRWLAPLPFIAAFQFLAADTLTGAGFQKVRSAVQVSAAVLNAGLNIWLIPLYSWQGAAWATLFSDSLRMLCLWLIVAFLLRREKQVKAS
ncbi:oligosaccharide flippase family protein [Pleurocapsales cyanobacterium LEGE 06147]|nr:oligosaccharide flippase family protein [Pleurocapsales cyanobacterium LEGE 06147]